MYKIVHLPTAEYVIDGHSTVDNPQVLYFDEKGEAKNSLLNNYFRSYPLSKTVSIIFMSSSTFRKPNSSNAIPKYLFEIVEVPDV
jgi:hypothetical protein